MHSFGWKLDGFDSHREELLHSDNLPQHLGIKVLKCVRDAGSSNTASRERIAR